MPARLLFAVVPSQGKNQSSCFCCARVRGIVRSFSQTAWALLSRQSFLPELRNSEYRGNKMIDRLTRLHGVLRLIVAALAVSLLLGSGMAIAKISTNKASASASEPRATSTSAAPRSESRAPAPVPAPASDPASAVAALKILSSATSAPPSWAAVSIASLWTMTMPT